MPEYGRPGCRGRLPPAIGPRVIALHEIDIAEVMPAADEIDVAVFVGHRDGIIDRDRHRRTRLELPFAGIEDVCPRRGYLGPVAGDAVAAEHIHLFPHGRGD